MIRTLVAEAVSAGARRSKACQLLGISVRTLERWGDEREDGRHGPKTAPGNKLSAAERQRILDVATSPEFRDESPKQIVPTLADRGIYIGSESTIYRTLHAANLQHRRGPARPPRHRPREYIAERPWQVASWDITYLKSHVRGEFFYLYLVVDVWSRKILGWDVHAVESTELASSLLQRIRDEVGHEVDLAGWVLHADNGGPIKGATMLATMQRLGVVPSFSRPNVSNDNPFSESLFRTMKYVPEYPRSGFASLEAARTWVAAFVQWYNFEHMHSGIGFVAPAAPRRARRCYPRRTPCSLFPRAAPPSQALVSTRAHMEPPRNRLSQSRYYSYQNERSWYGCLNIHTTTTLILIGLLTQGTLSAPDLCCQGSFRLG